MDTRETHARTTQESPNRGTVRHDATKKHEVHVRSAPAQHSIGLQVSGYVHRFVVHRLLRGSGRVGGPNKNESPKIATVVYPELTIPCVYRKWPYVLT